MHIISVNGAELRKRIQQIVDESISCSISIVRIDRKKTKPNIKLGNGIREIHLLTLDHKIKDQDSEADMKDINLIAKKILNTYRDGKRSHLIIDCTYSISVSRAIEAALNEYITGKAPNDIKYYDKYIYNLMLRSFKIIGGTMGFNPNTALGIYNSED